MLDQRLDYVDQVVVGRHMERHQVPLLLGRAWVVVISNWCWWWGDEVRVELVSVEAVEQVAHGARLHVADLLKKTKMMTGPEVGPRESCR